MPLSYAKEKKPVREIFIIVVTFNIIALIKIHKMRDAMRRKKHQLILLIALDFHSSEASTKKADFIVSISHRVHQHPATHQPYFFVWVFSQFAFFINVSSSPSLLSLSLRIITNFILSRWQPFPLFALSSSVWVGEENIGKTFD